MKFASAAFVLLLLAAHAVGRVGELVARPLSLFRDADHAWLGYAVFVALGGVGAMYVITLARYRRAGEAVVAGLAVFLLLAVAETPSWGVWHLLWSALLLLLLFGYFAVLLYRARSAWLLGHLAVPVVLALVTQFHSYGIWQKSLIVYFVLAATIHHHMLVQHPLPEATPSRPRRGRKKRKVYRLEPGPEWQRTPTPKERRRP